MKFLSLLLLSCACSFSLQGVQCEFKQLAARVENELHYAPLGEALLQIDALLEVNTSTQELEASIKKAEEALQAARKAANCCDFLEAGCDQAACKKELLPLFSRVKTEIAKSFFELQKRKTKEKKTVLQDCPSSVCNGVITITAATTIMTPGHYCLTKDITGTIEINSSNVELSLDKHTISGAQPILIDDGVSNVKIGGCGTLNGLDVGVGITFVGTADNVTIEDIEIIKAVSGILQNSDLPIRNITYKNSDFIVNDFGIVLFNFANVTISSCLFNSDGVGILTEFFSSLDNQGLTVEDCFFDFNLEAITLAGVDDVFINRTFITNSSGAGITTSFTGLPTVFLNNVYIKDTIIDNVLAEQTPTPGNGNGNGIQLDTVSNLKIEGCQILNTVAEGILLTNAQNVLVENTQVLETGFSPIRVANLFNGAVSGSIFSTSVGVAPFAAMTASQSQGFQVRNCVLSSLLQDPMTAGVNGIAIQNCTGFEIENSIIETNARSTDDLGGSGIVISDSSMTGVIRGCILPNIQPNIAAEGIFVTGDNQDMRIEDCTIDGAYHTGLRLEGLQYGLVQNNQIKSMQTGSGIALKAANGVSILGNMIVGNGTHGIHLAKHTISCAIRDNTVAKNKKVGIKNHSQNKSNTIYHNFAQANGEQNYQHVGLVSSPHKGVGLLENISS